MELSFSAWRRDGHQPVPTSAESLETDLAVVAYGPVFVVEDAPLPQDPRNRKRDNLWWYSARARQYLFCLVLIALTVTALFLVPSSGDVGGLAAHSFTGGLSATLGLVPFPPPAPPPDTVDIPPPPHPSPPLPPTPPPNLDPPGLPPVMPLPAQPPCASITEDCELATSLGCCYGFSCITVTVMPLSGVPNDVSRCSAAPQAPPDPPLPPVLFRPPPSPPPPRQPPPPPSPSPPPSPFPPPLTPCEWTCERFYTTSTETAARAADRWCHEEVRFSHPTPPPKP